MGVTSRWWSACRRSTEGVGLGPADASTETRLVLEPSLAAEGQLSFPRLAQARPMDHAGLADPLEDRQRVPARVEDASLGARVGEHRVLIVEPVLLDPAEIASREVVGAPTIENGDGRAGVGPAKAGSG